MHTPYFSVLIASMGANNLVDALLSIHATGELDYEVVLVVDKPGLDDRAIGLDRLPEELRARMKVLYNTENVGVTMSLNKGLAECRGEIVCRLDDDDRFLASRFSLLRQCVKTHSDADVFTGGAIVKNHNDDQYILNVPRQHQMIVRGLERRNVLIHSAFNIRREVLLSVGGYNDEYYYAQDYELYLRLIRRGVRFVGIEQPIVERFEGAASITVRKRRHQSLYSLSALALHHARSWGAIERSPMLVTHGFVRFATPQFVRRLVRKIRGLRKVIRL